MPAEHEDHTTHPTEAELLFLKLAYDRFYSLFEEIMNDNFFKTSDTLRFSKLVNAFAVFTELTKYKPIKWTIEQIRRDRPPGEAEIASDVVRFVRHVVAHYPLFDRWRDVWISGELAAWDGHPASIEKFLKDYGGHPPYKFRFWEEDKKRMTYAQISFPELYEPSRRVYLNDLIDEQSGCRLFAVLMKKIMDSQTQHD